MIYRNSFLQEQKKKKGKKSYAQRGQSSVPSQSNGNCKQRKNDRTEKGDKAKVNHYQSLKKCLHIEQCFPVVVGGYRMIQLKQSEQVARQFHVCPNPKFVAGTMPHRQYISLFQSLLPKNQQPNMTQRGLIYKDHNEYCMQLRKNCNAKDRGNQKSRKQFQRHENKLLAINVLPISGVQTRQQIGKIIKVTGLSS